MRSERLHKKKVKMRQSSSAGWKRHSGPAPIQTPSLPKGGHYWPGILQLSYSRYLEKIAEAWGWAQTPLSALIEEAFKVCNNQDLMDNKDKRLMKHSFWLLWFTHHLKSTLGGWVCRTDHQGAAWAQIHCVSLSERGPLEGRMAWTPSCGMPKGQPWLAPVPCESPGWEILEHQLMGPKWCPAPDSTRSILIIPGELRVTLDVAVRSVSESATRRCGRQKNWIYCRHWRACSVLTWPVSPLSIHGLYCGRSWQPAKRRAIYISSLPEELGPLLLLMPFCICQNALSPSSGEIC